jgi:RHS repeat-associated protein
VIDQIDYTYDAAGQRISKTMLNGSSAPETNMSASFDAGNRMQTITLNPGKPEQKIYNLNYDNNGNLTKKQLSTDANCTTDCTEYVWDARNRLTQIKQNQTTSTTYSYDVENRRIQASITQNGSTNQVSYIYAGSQAVGEVRNQQLSHSLMTGLQMDEHIARIALASGNQGTTSSVKTYLTDALGSVIAIANADQSLEVGYAYSPYGQTQKVGVENQQAGSENSSKYTGRESDTNGLYFYRARYYDPVLKRFISEDPIGLAGGPNVYSYVDGNPVTKTDPTGLTENDPTPPDTSPCQYYKNICNELGCQYHCHAYNTCMNNGATFDSRAANAVLRLCKVDNYHTNQIRKCLVREDAMARSKPACQVPAPASKTCPEGNCTSKKCIDDYHNKCFNELQIGGSIANLFGNNMCYGGNYPYNYANDD